MAYTFDDFLKCSEQITCDSQIKILSYGCKNIDTLMGRSLLLKGIIELYGESGVGKTQMCMQIAIEYSHNNIINEKKNTSIIGILYVSTMRFPTRRLQQIIKKRYPIEYDAILDKILIIDIKTITEFFKIFKEKENLRKNAIDLIIIDSITPLFLDFGLDTDNSQLRTQNVSQMCYLLHKLNKSKMSGHQFKTGLGIICTNEIRANIHNP
ncbi:hypothetical protein MXB_449, partial [Myxobolus squamalis]